jgi:hypothetical protein
MCPVLRWLGSGRQASGLLAVLLFAGAAPAQGGEGDEALAKLLALKKELPGLVAKTLNTPPAPGKTEVPKEMKPPLVRPGAVLPLPGAAGTGFSLPAPTVTAAVKVARRIAPREARIKLTLTLAGYRWLAKPLYPPPAPPGTLPRFRSVEGSYASTVVTDHVTLHLRFQDGAWTTTGFEVSWDRARTADSQEAGRLLALERKLHQFMLEIDQLGGE